MNKLNRILVLFILSSSLSNAQDELYSISTNVGYGLSDFTHNHYDAINPNSTYSTELRSTFTANISVRRQFSRIGLFIQTGIKWDGYGWKHSHNYSIWNGNDYDQLTNINTTNLSFFTIPLIVTYKLNKFVPGFTINAGPQISLFSYRKWKQNGNFLDSQVSVPDYAFSINFALGYEYNLAENWNLGIEVFSNLIPKNVYNFGAGINARYILKTHDQ